MQLTLARIENTLKLIDNTRASTLDFNSMGVFIGEIKGTLQASERFIRDSNANYEGSQDRFDKLIRTLEEFSMDKDLVKSGEWSRNYLIEIIKEA